MNPAQPTARRVPHWFSVGLLAAVFSCGVAWATMVVRVDAIEARKLDASRFEKDSTRREARDGAVLEKLGEISRKVDETNQRVREIACAGRVGCR